jgi:hypothetical protein
MTGMAEQQTECRNRMADGIVEWREWREWQNGRKNGRMAEWQKWLHTYYLWYTLTPTTPTTPTTLNSFIFLEKLPDFWEMNPRTFGLPISKYAST